MVHAAESAQMSGDVSPSDADRRQYLDHLQGAISRMSASSTSAKTWLLPVATASYGYAITKPSWPVALLGIFAVLLFAYVDAYYLQLERDFRSLYRRATTDTLRDNEVRPSLYDMAPPSRWPQKIVWRSPSIWLFYSALLIVGIIVTVVARYR